MSPTPHQRRRIPLALEALAPPRVNRRAGGVGGTTRTVTVKMFLRRRLAMVAIMAAERERGFGLPMAKKTLPKRGVGADWNMGARRIIYKMS